MEKDKLDKVLDKALGKSDENKSDKKTSKIKTQKEIVEQTISKKLIIEDGRQLLM